MAVTTITLDTYKQQIGSQDAFNLQSSFNGRVGDEQVPLVVQFLERGHVHQFDGGLVPFVSGFVGELDEDGRVTAETGTAVSYVGSESDIIGLGKVKMNLPGTMFPQEGYFYGFLGLETPDHSHRESTFSVWFHVYNGNPDMFVNKEPFRTELQKLLDSAQALIDAADGDVKAKLLEWQTQINELITNLNGDYATIQLTVTSLNSQMKTLQDKIDAGGLITKIDFKEVVDARNPDGKMPYKTLGERLNDMPFSSEFTMEEGYDDIDGGIPGYNDVSLSNLKNSINTNLFNFGFGTDYHYISETDNIPFSNVTLEDSMRYYSSGLRKSLNLLSLSDKLDAVVFNGDNVDQPINPDIKLERKMMIKEHNDFATTAFSSALCPVFLLKGNHDCNYNISSDKRLLDNVILDEDFAKLYQQNGKYGEQRLNGSNYYYKDFEDKKIRLIGLDSSDLPETTNADGTMMFNRFTQSGFQQAQLNWLANDALQVPNDYTVVITMHWPLNHTVYDYDDSGMINHGALKTILEDFVTGCGHKTITSSGSIPVAVDYVFATAGNLAGVLSGHRHLDQQKTINGVNYILTRCSLICGDNMIKEKRLEYDGTPSEDAFDIVSIDTDNRILTTTRFGAGSEDANYAKRTINY